MNALYRRLPAIAILCVAAIIAVVASGLLVRTVEARSQADVAQVLRDGGYDWARVRVDGLQVRVSGIAPSEAVRFRALTAAGTVVDSARVIDGVQVAEAKREAPIFSIELLRNEDDISLIGLLPAGMDRDGFMDEVRRISGGGDITDLLDTAEHPVPDGWTPAVAFGLDALRTLPRSKISITAGAVTVSGIGEDTADRRRLETELSRRAPEGLKVALDISAPRPAIVPFTLRFLIDADGKARFDACSADTPEAQSKILKAAANAGLAGKVTCTIGLGAPSPRWGEAAVLAIGAVKDLGGGTVTISDADVSLVALESVSQDTFDTVTGTLDNKLPDAFSLTAVKPEPEAAAGTDAAKGPAEFVATLAEDGGMQIRGRVKDERQQSVIDSYAKGLFGAGAVQNATRLDDGLADSWAVRVLAGLEAMDGLAEGKLVVGADRVSVTGRTGDPDKQAQVSGLLSSRLGEGADFDIDVSYDKKLDPVLGLPTAEECVSDINAAIAKNKINFDPGSASIDKGAGPTLDRIAALMKNCADYPMEIGGHTDSQGREEMNQQLSQSRAEAVLEALLERRANTVNLTALGYGETQPVADNGTEEGREANRRIEFRLVKGEETEDTGAADGGDMAPDANGNGGDAAGTNGDAAQGGDGSQ